MNAEQLQQLIDDAAESLRELSEIISQYPEAYTDFALNLGNADEVAEKLEGLEIQDGESLFHFVIHPQGLATKTIYESDGGWAAKWQTRQMDEPVINYFPTRVAAEKFLKEVAREG
jgi:hypothetical protein